jgi:hypothetical protein
MEQIVYQLRESYKKQNDLQKWAKNAYKATENWVMQAD